MHWGIFDNRCRFPADFIFSNITWLCLHKLLLSNIEFSHNSIIGVIIIKKILSTILNIRISGFSHLFYYSLEIRNLDPHGINVVAIFLFARILSKNRNWFSFIFRKGFPKNSIFSSWPQSLVPFQNSIKIYHMLYKSFSKPTFVFAAKFIGLTCFLNNL